MRLGSNKFVVVSLVALAALSVVGCKKSTYKNSNSPDEFAISRNAPLVVPPDFSLVPPKPGAPRALGADSQTQAVEALFGPGAKPPPKSASEQQLLDKAGATKPDPSARSTAGDATNGAMVDKGAFVQELLAARPGSTNAAVASVSTGG
jgi:hypothetical protein